MTAVVEVEEGWDFKVLILEGEWVLRIPRSERTFEELNSEVALLPAIADSLPVAIPRFETVSSRPRFVVYRLIPGRPLRDEDPSGVRAFLEALHAIDTAGLPARRPDWLEIYRSHAADWRRVVLPLLDRDERPQAEGLLAEIETLAGFTPALAHCDLGPAHLLVDGGRLSGVIDWANAKIGDPALDYAWLLNVPFPDWEVDDELRRRARVYHRIGPWFEVEHGVRTGRPEFVRSGLEGVRSRL